MADYLVVPTSRPVFRPSRARRPCCCSSFPTPPWHLLVRAFIPKATTSQETNTLFVLGNAATLVTDACLKGELCSWLDRARFWHLVLQNGYLSLRGIPDGIVGSLTYRIVDERQGANISTDEKEG